MQDQAQQTSGGEQPLLELSNVSKHFGGVMALQNVDFTLLRGEIHGLVGENGAGKSTTMKIIAGVHTDFDGGMKISGREVRLRSAGDALANSIGMVHQELSVIPDLTVAENVFLGNQPLTAIGTVDWGRMNREAKKLIASLGLDIDPTTTMSSLPVGLQQLVELSRVLFSGAQIIILDEPTSALSPPEVKQLFAVLRRLRTEGRSIVFISHFLDDVLDISDRVTVFRNGKKVITEDTKNLTKDIVIAHMIGRGSKGMHMGEEAELRGDDAKPVVLSVRGVSDGRNLRDFSIELRAGEITGVYGFMGSGQIELARALFGKIPLRRGSLQLDGIHRLWLKPRAEKRITEAHIKDLQIRPPRTAIPLGSLSGGNQQKVALAKWLTHLPRVLILSEPTRGMDVGAKEDVIRIVKSLRDRGVAILVLSTEPETILTLADRVTVIRKGTVAREFATGHIEKADLLAAA